MSEKSLKEKTFSGLGWSSADKIFQQVVVFISGIFLSRILDNEDFGKIGILAIFSGLSNIILDSGFSAAIIRKKQVTQADYITVFYSNISIAIFLYLVLFFCAPLLCKFQDNDLSLIPLARFIFLAFLFNAFGVVQNARLYKELNYKLITKANITSVFVSYFTALILALLGYGPWALASQIVIYSCVRTCILWLLARWKPSGRFSMESFREFFTFSSTLTAGNLLGSVVNNLPQNVLGKIYSLNVTGIYYNSSKYYNTVLEFLSGSILSVPYPVLSAVHEEHRLKRIFRKFVRVKAFIIFPTFMGMILVADPFVNVCLGDKWISAIPVLQFLCLGGIFYALDSSNGDIFKIQNKSGFYLIFSILHVIAMGIAIAVTYILKLNYIWFIAILSIMSMLRYFASSIVANRLIKYKFREFCKDQFPYFFIALATIFCGYLLKFLIYNKLILMLCQISLVGSLYLGILFFSGSVIVRDALNLLWKRGNSF